MKHLWVFSPPRPRKQYRKPIAKTPFADGTPNPRRVYIRVYSSSPRFPTLFLTHVSHAACGFRNRPYPYDPHSQRRKYDIVRVHAETRTLVRAQTRRPFMQIKPPQSRWWRRPSRWKSPVYPYGFFAPTFRGQTNKKIIIIEIRILFFLVFCPPHG